ncbi:MAG: pirin family protein [Candidatus Marinimicrobia bacterium]|nr:pirin family protein [Candidatus Neomarinimicrobiota bacterium]
MIDVIPFQSLGIAKHGWLTARHHFSFARYYDPARQGYPPLLVWNDDEIQAGTGFDMHPHDNMEIITYVRQGAITHRDNMGNEGRTEAGDVQVMSAGTGVYHSEHNEESEDTILFQIWIHTAQRDVSPRWEARSFPKKTSNTLIPLVSGREIHKPQDPLHIYQDAAIFAGVISRGHSFTQIIDPGRHAYLVVSEGSIDINGHELKQRDGVYIKDEDEIVITAKSDAEIVLADLPILSS